MPFAVNGIARITSDTRGDPAINPMSPISEETFRAIQNSDALTLSVDILVATDAVARALRDRLDMIAASDPRFAEVEKQLAAAQRERAEAIAELVGIYCGCARRFLGLSP
jgi:hypothetical protein